MRRFVVGALLVKLVLALVLGAGLGLGYMRLASGPITFDGLSRQVESSIAARLGPGWHATLRDSAVELDAEGALALRASGLDIRNPEGALVVRAPLAVVSLDTWSLVTATFQARAIDFRDLQLRALVRRDGSIEFAAADADTVKPPSSAPAAPIPSTTPVTSPAADAPSALSTAVASVLGLVVDPRGVVGALDRARLTNARVTLVDEDGRERAAFHRVDGLFRRTGGAEGRSFEMRLDGPHGAWRFGGDVHDLADGRRRGVLTLDDLPSVDLLLLSGFSRLPVTTDLKLSVRANVELAANRLSAMDLAVRTSDGTILIEEKDFKPIAIEGLSARASWDEAGRRLDIGAIEYLGGGNEVRLKGALSTAPGIGAAWTLALDGRDATLRGAGEKDDAVKVAGAEIRLAGRDGGIALDRMVLKGPELDGTMTGSAGAASDRRGMTLKIDAQATGVRAALRLWPENIIPPVREYLVRQLRGGRVDSLRMAVAMSDAELATAAAGGPVPDDAVRIAFNVSDARMRVAEGAPAISGARVSGEVTGTATRIRGASAQLRLSDTRRLTIEDGSFVVADAQPGNAVAKVGFRLGGSADALAALLQTPFLKGLSGAEMDPATIKGGVDLRVDFPISLDNPGEVVDLPVTIAGALTDVALDKAFGKDRIEAQRLALSYDQSGFALKGDARLAGAATTLDLRQARGGGAGEAVVTVVLDEALRAKKGLPVAPLLAGPVPARIVAPLGKGRGATRVEADLTRAAIDGALPGWTKAAGRPGKLTFTLAENGDLKDIVLDAGTTSLRGTASVSTDGTLERADLTQLRLSTGDDLRAQVERQGNAYRVTVRGNTADARPFLKSLGNAAVANGSGKDAPARDIEADIAINILTGFNGEALTNAALKLSRRGSEVRAFQLQGRFGGAGFSAQMTKPDRGGAPMLKLQSDNAGATLRYLDIYGRMVGGSLGLQASLSDGPQSGAIEVRNFSLRNEPALKSIMSQGGEELPASAPGGERGANARIRELDGGGIGFDRASARFVKTNGRIDFREAAISGPAMGFTLNGWLDYARDRTDVSGTFVPLYGLNNAFSQLPLLGPLLTGGQNEGIFAINFRVAGSVAQPQVSVNPLSAVAPGFLRKLFSAGGGDDLLTGSAPSRPMSDR